LDIGLFSDSRGLQLLNVHTATGLLLILLNQLVVAGSIYQLKFGKKSVVCTNLHADKVKQHMEASGIW
jgi:hypothetical protein